MPKLLEIKAKTKMPIDFTIRVELGDGQESPLPRIRGPVSKRSLLSIAENPEFRYLNWKQQAREKHHQMGVNVKFVRR